MSMHVYDLETYPNCFLAGFKCHETGALWVFEVSDRRDDTRALMAHLEYLKNSGAWLVGFNNIGFDWPILWEWWQGEGRGGYSGPYTKCQAIIQGDPFDHIIWDPAIPQIDLYKIHHFDNKARRTGLKQLEFNMRATSIKDLPYPPGTWLDDAQKDDLVDYLMEGDIPNTHAFLVESLPAIEFRTGFGPKWMNYNDTKMGKQYFTDMLQAAGVDTTKQSPRPSIALRECILPDIKLSTPSLNRVHQWLLAQTITETKGVFQGLVAVVEGFEVMSYGKVANVDGFEVVFGLGGIHACMPPGVVHSDDDWIVEDWDVASYYPNLSISKRLYPEHLGEIFCDICADMYKQRKQYAKGSPENAVMKLALNGTWGDSNNPYSVFYDPKYTMSVTLNGQLLLCMLMEQMKASCPYLQMIQMNTDGLTVRYPRSWQGVIHEVAATWEQVHGLTLEDVEYTHMWIRDVNNYIAQDVDGGIKRKGAYEYEREHHQNHSALVIPKAAEMVLVHGWDAEAAVRSHKDIYDFCLRVKAPQLEFDGVPQQSTCRYYVSETGGTLKSIKPPPAGCVAGDYKRAQGVSKNEYSARNITGQWDELIHTKNKSVYGSLISEVEKGQLITLCNSIDECENPVEMSWYINMVLKLTQLA